MPNYGKQTQGATERDIEIDVVGREITLPGGELIIAAYAYLRTTNGSTGAAKVVLYNASNGLAYESNELTGIQDDVGGWKTFTFSGITPSAGTYKLSIGAGPIAGGANTLNIAYDAVAATTALRENSNILGGAQATYPTFPATITWGAADNTEDISLYLATSSGGAASGSPNLLLMGVG